MKNSLSLKNSLFIIVVFFFSSTSILQAQNLDATIDSLLQAKYKPNAPGAIFLIAKEGTIIYNKAFGLSNLELNVPMISNSVFEIGSMTKQFTAISIMMLMEKGKLNLDDEITKFIPDYPTHGNKITVHHLLTHTSGIKNFTSMKEIRNIATKNMAPTDLIDFFKNEPMDFNPGDEFKYSNSGYVILGYIIETVAEKSYADFVEQDIFEKLGMTSSQYASHSKVIKNRTSGYHNRNGYINTRYVSFTIPYSSGSLMSTVEDMNLWQQAIKNNSLISAKTTNKVFTNYTLNKGESINYGYGWHIKDLNGSLSYEHGGSIFGFKSMGVYLPESDIYVIGLNNCDCNSPTVITREIAELALNK